MTVAVATDAAYTVAASPNDSAMVIVRDDEIIGPPLTFAVSPASAPAIEGVALAIESVVRTVADGTFTASGDLARVLPGLVLGNLRLRWGQVTHLRTTAADIVVTPLEHGLAAANFAPYAAADGATGIEARRTVDTLTPAADGVAEEPEGLLVALERTAGPATVLIPAAHPGAPGFGNVALADGAFFRTALTVRDQPLMLDLETIGIDEGQSVDVRATMMPPRAQAFTVTVSVDNATRAGLVGTNATLSFAPGATHSTGDVRIRAKRTPEGDGDVDVTVTGTPQSASGVAAATATLRVSERGGSSGAVLWETELTVGHYFDTDAANSPWYGYADVSKSGLVVDNPDTTDTAESAAGALVDATFSFQGVTYTVERLTLGPSTARVPELGAEFEARSEYGTPLVYGNPNDPSFYGNGEEVTSLQLGLEVEGAGGAAWLRPLRPEDGPGVLAGAAAWDGLTGQSVTVRLIDLGPMVWWDGRLLPDNKDAAHRYQVTDGVPTGYLVPDAFELENAAGVRELYTVDLLEVAESGGSNKLRFSTTPDLPPDIASLLASRRDYLTYDPDSGGVDDMDTPADESDDYPATPPEILYVFPLTTAAQSSADGVDYEIALPALTAALAPEALTVALQRALLVPMAGAGDSAPPPPALEEFWRADVTVGERPHVDTDDDTELQQIGVDNGLEHSAGRFGDISDWRIPVYDDAENPNLQTLKFNTKGAVTQLFFIPNFQRIRHATRFESSQSDGLEIQGDYGARVHWLRHYCCLAGELEAQPWINVDTDHGWEAGEVHRVRLVRPRHGAYALSIPEGVGRVREDDMGALQVDVSLRLGYLNALPRGVATEVTVSASGVTKDVTIPARQEHVDVEMTVPLPADADHGWLDVEATPKDVRFAGTVLLRLGSDPVESEEEERVALLDPADSAVPLIWPEDADPVEYWSASLRVAEEPPTATKVENEEDKVNAKFLGFSDADISGVDTGALAPRRFACCGAPLDSAAARTAWAVGDPEELFEAGFVLGLDRLGDAVPDDLAGATLRLDQVAYQHPPNAGALYYPLVSVALPFDDAEVGSVVLEGATRRYLEWDQLYLDIDRLGDYRVRITVPGDQDRAVLTAVDLVSSPGPDGLYGAGESLAVRLSFDEPVTVAGTPTLAFLLGTADRTATYAYGTGTTELVFTYPVVSTDGDADLLDVKAFPASLVQDPNDGAIRSVARDNDAVYANYDPPPWAVTVRGGQAGTPPPASLGDVRISEAAGSARLTVTLDAAATAAETYRYATADGTALAASDYVAASGTVTVGVGARTASIEVRVLDDAVIEPTESFAVRLWSVDQPLFQEATVTIVDDDRPTVTIAPPPLAAGGGHLFEHETGAGAVWTLARSGPTAAGLSVNVNVAERGGDFVPVAAEGNAVVEFPAGASTVTFTPVEDDALRERNGTVTVGLLSGAGYGLGDPANLSTTVAVRDDDGALVSVGLEPTVLTVAEGTPARVFVVAQTLPARASGAYGSLTEPGDIARVLGPHYAMGDVGVDLATATGDGYTASAADFTALDKTLAGIRLADFRATPGGGPSLRLAETVDTTADTEADDGETFGIVLADLEGADGRVVLADATSVVTIRDGAALSLAFSATNDTITEGDSNADTGTTTVTATVSAAQTSPFTVTVTGQSPDDGRWEFVEANPTLSFDANATASTGTVTIRAVPNDIDEPALEVVVRGAPSTDAVAPASAVLTVADDDLPKISIAAPPIAVETGHVFEHETAAPDSQRWTLTRVGVLDAALDVAVSVTETGSGDLVPAATETANQTVAFAAGSATAGYSPVDNDTTDEAHGTVTVAIATGTGYEADSDANSASAAVRDDDGAALLTLSPDPLALSVVEGGAAQLYVTGTTVADGTFTSPADLDRVFGVEQHAMTATVGGIAGAGETATADTDYDSGELSVTVAFDRFGANATADGLTGRAALPPIAVYADGADEDAETFDVRPNYGTLPTGVAAHMADGAVARSKVTIFDEPALSIAVDATLAEGDTTAVAVTVEPAHDEAFTATLAGTPEDARWRFVSPSTSPPTVLTGPVALTFAANQTAPAQVLAIEAPDNTTDETNLELTLSATPGVSGITAAEAKVEIQDDDLPVVSIAGPEKAAGDFLYEAEAVVDMADRKWTLTRVGLTDATLAVQVRVSETGGGDFVASATEGTQTVTFEANSSTVSYTPVSADTVDESHGTVTVAVTDGTDYDVDPDKDSATAAIRDDDGEVLTVTVDSPTVAEGDDAVFTVTAENDDGTLTESAHLQRLFGVTAVAAEAASADGSAEAPDDYAAVPANTAVSIDTYVSVSGGAKWTGTVETTTVLDSDDDADETFTLTVTLPSGTDGRIRLGSPATGTATLVMKPTVKLAVSPETITEGEEPAAEATLTATVSPVHDAAFTVPLTADPEPDTDRLSFPDGRTFRFAANASTATLRVRAVDNDDDEEHLEVEFGLGTPNDDGVHATDGTAELTVEDDEDPVVSIAGPEKAAGDFLYEAEAMVDMADRKWTLTRVGLTDETLAVEVRVSETGGDFVAPGTEGTQTVTFEANAETVSYTPVSADTADEAHGTVTVALTDGTDYDVDPAKDSAAAAIRDDDGEILTVTVDSVTVAEGDDATFTVTAANDDGTLTATAHLGRLFDGITAVTVEVATADGTGDGGATAPADYAAIVAGTEASLGTFAATAGGAVWTGSVSTSTVEDEVLDANETFTLTVTLPSGTDARIRLGTPATGTATLTEGLTKGSLRLCTTEVDTAEDSTITKTHTCTAQGDDTRLAKGRVEMIWENEEWGTVCDDRWDDFDGHVACRQMGHEAGQRVFTDSFFGGASKGTKTFLDDLRCNGDEATLFDCRRAGKQDEVGTHNCNRRDVHTEDAGVRCLAEQSETLAAGLDPKSLTLAPGETGRYWVALTKFPDPDGSGPMPAQDVWIEPNRKDGSGPLEISVPGSLETVVRFIRADVGWSFARAVDVTVDTDAAPGAYTLEHTSGWGYDPASDAYDVPDMTVTVAASSGAPPRPLSASVAGRDAAVRFDAPLDASFEPSGADFVVLAGTRPLDVAGAWTAGPTLLLELAESAPAGSAVRLAYAPSPSAPLVGRDGAPVAPFEATVAAAANGDAEPDDRAAFAPKLEGAPGLAAALADALERAPGPAAATLVARRRDVADLSAIGAVPGLRRLDLSGNAVTDAGPLAQLPNLERLDLSDNALEDLWWLSALPELRVLNLSGNRIADVTALSGLPQLEVLELAGNAVADVTSLGTMSSLRYLGLSGNNVTDVTPLAELYALVRLDLGGNRVADATPLGDVERLVWLRLSGNRLATLEGLGRLARLRWVWVADNPAPDAGAWQDPEGAWVDTPEAP